MLPENITNAELHLLAYRSRETLRARLKAVAREHADRMKRIETVMQQIGSVQPEHEDLPGVGPRISLTPDLELLLVNPTHGL
jgi:hypothetical protein